LVDFRLAVIPLGIESQYFRIGKAYSAQTARPLLIRTTVATTLFLYLHFHLHWIGFTLGRILFPDKRFGPTTPTETASEYAFARAMGTWLAVDDGHIAS
jgi:hypothetical protein